MKQITKTSNDFVEKRESSKIMRNIHIQVFHSNFASQGFHLCSENKKLKIVIL